MLKQITTTLTITLCLGVPIALGMTETGARVLEDPAGFFNPSQAHPDAQEHAFPASTAPAYAQEQERVARMMATDLDPRLQRASSTLVIADLSTLGAAGMVDWQTSPNTLYIEPGTASGEEDSLLWVLSHEAAHVDQFEAYDVAGKPWLDQQRLDRLTRDAHRVLPETETHVQAVEMLADCMAASALPSQADAHGTAYLDDPSVCSDPGVAAAVETLLDGEPLSTSWWQ